MKNEDLTNVSIAYQDHDGNAVLDQKAYLKLLLERGEVIEIRTFGNEEKGSGSYGKSGFFDELDPLCEAALKLDSDPNETCVYSTLNSPDRARLKSAGIKIGNKLGRRLPGRCLGDEHVGRRIWIPFDFDRAAKSDAPATEEELEQIKEHAEVFRLKLEEFGWPEPIIACSGNGIHLLYPCDLSVEESQPILRDLYRHSKVLFTNEMVKFDSSVQNPARIWKVYGTLSKKGTPTEDRPHRRSSVFSRPGTLELVDLDTLRKTVNALEPEASKVPAVIDLDKVKELGSGDYRTLDVVGWFQAHGLYLKPLGKGKHAVRCPWNDSHSDPNRLPRTSTVVWEIREGYWPEFKCSHNSCEGRRIRHVMDLLGDADSHCAGEYQGGGSGLPKLDYTRYYAVIGDEKAWDALECRSVSYGNLRFFYGEEQFKEWSRSPYRRNVEHKNIRFAPGEDLDPRLYVNTYKGLDLEPDPEASCRLLLAHFKFLCNNDQTLCEHALNWLAYPLQNPGVKMQTSLVFKGMPGVGKNIFFNALLEIYGEYGIAIGQGTLDGDFNCWTPRKLLVVADEVLTPKDKKQYSNRLKRYITEPTLVLNAKNEKKRTDRNCMNFVFLSNETTPLQLDPGDRRYIIIQTPSEPRSPEYYRAIGKELKEGGAAALLHYLLNRELPEDFDEHTRAPMTAAKRRMIEAAGNPQEHFLREILEKEPILDTELPVGNCQTRDLYRAYTIWCKVNGFKHTGTEAKFKTYAEQCFTVKRVVVTYRGVDGLEKTGKRRFYIPDLKYSGRAACETQGEEFARALEKVECRARGAGLISGYGKVLYLDPKKEEKRGPSDENGPGWGPCDGGVEGIEKPLN